MKFKFFAVVALLSASFLFTGCYSTVDGRSKAGWPISKDTITSRYEFSVDQIVAASREVLKRNGQIVSDDAVTHSFSAKINQRDVYVIASKVDDKVSEVKVQARHGGLGDINLASDMSTQIGIQLAVNH